MKAKSMFVYFVVVCSAIVIGLSFIGMQVFLRGEITKATWIGMSVLVLILTFSLILRKLLAYIKSGMPVEDERSTKIRMYAAGYAYFVSIYLWLILLIFRENFDRDDIIIFGLVGMAVSFGISFLILNNRKG